jgi:hypothetical protein
MVTGSVEATGLFLAIGQHTTQHFSVEYARTIENLLTTHPELTISIVQAKHDPTLVGFKRTRHLILEAVKRPRNNIKDLKSIKFQKAESKAAALQAWDQRFYDTPHTPQAYDSALTSPPDGRPHTVLRMASTGIRIKG